MPQKYVKWSWLQGWSSCCGSILIPAVKQIDAGFAMETFFLLHNVKIVFCHCWAHVNLCLSVYRLRLDFTARIKGGGPRFMLKVYPAFSFLSLSVFPPLFCVHTVFHLFIHPRLCFSFTLRWFVCFSSSCVPIIFHTFQNIKVCAEQFTFSLTSS